MIRQISLRAALGYDVDEASAESALFCLEPTLAKQSFAEEADINTIVRRFRIGGEPASGVHAPVFGDFTGVHDFHSAMNAVALANESFEAMPAEVRARFVNDPQRFVEFCSDPKNTVEMASLGLLAPGVEALRADPVPVGPLAAAVAPAPSIAPTAGGA